MTDSIVHFGKAAAQTGIPEPPTCLALPIERVWGVSPQRPRRHFHRPSEARMLQPRRSPPPSLLGFLVLLVVLVGGGAAAFAYTAGWFSRRVSRRDKLVAAFAPPGGPSLGHRRNHAKGICFTGVFQSNGAGTSLSKAQIFVSGQYPALGRFNLGTVEANAVDAKERVRGIGLRITPRMGRNGAWP